MSHDRCPRCDRRIRRSIYDATFRADDGTETLVFELPGMLCPDCKELFVDPDMLERMGLTPRRCVFAIESDVLHR